MYLLSEFRLLIATTIATALATLFCIIGLATPAWKVLTPDSGLFSINSPGSPAALAIISMLLLVTCVIILGLFIIGIIDHEQILLIRLIVSTLLIISCIFLLSAFGSYFGATAGGYSYNLTIVAFAFAYIASLLATFWLGTGSHISKTYSVEKSAEIQ